MSGGTDVFSATTFDPTTWSEQVTPTFGSDGTTVTGVTITASGSADVTLTGSVSASGDTVTFTRISDDFQAGMKAVFDISGGIVLTDGADDYFAFFAQPFTTGQIYPALSGFGHYSQSGSAACFVAGTRIRTPDGFSPIEDLRPGDRVATAIGRLPARIVWVGSRRIRCDRHPRPWDVRPVRVAAGALAPNTPSRDLYLSPDHALLIDGTLVPVRHLLNGATIVQTTQALVTYHHVELARHDVLFAEGAPAESFLDTGNRASFAPGDPAPVTETAAGRAAACAPLLTDGPALLDIRRHLLLRAHALGNRLGSDPALRVTADERTLDIRASGPTYRVTIPPDVRSLRLDSLVARPAETMSGDPDHRTLGLCVVGLRFDGAALSLDNAALTGGWHPAEGGRRWTTGAAILAMPPSNRTRELVVMAAHELLYWVARTPARRATDRSSDTGDHNETVMRRRSGDERFVLQFDDSRAHAPAGTEQRRPPQPRDAVETAPGSRNREGNRHHDHRLHFA